MEKVPESEIQQRIGRFQSSLEDDFLVTSSGLERLTLTEQALIRIEPDRT